MPQRWAQEAAALLPHGELAVVPDCPHDANYSVSERLAAAVLPFLAVPPPGRRQPPGRNTTRRQPSRLALNSA